MQQLFVHIPDSTRTDPIFSDITLPASNLHILYLTQHYKGQREVLSLVQLWEARWSQSLRGVLLTFTSINLTSKL